MKTIALITACFLTFSLRLIGQNETGQSKAQENAYQSLIYSVDNDWGSGTGYAFLLGGAALVIPSPCTKMKFKDDNGSIINNKGLGCGFDLESYCGKYLVFGGSIKYNSSKYLGFAPNEGGYLSGKIDLGLGIPTNSNMVGGIYFGGSVGAGYVGIKNPKGAISHGYWAFIGNNYLGIKFSYDIFSYKDVIPDNMFAGLITRHMYSTQFKLYLGHYITVGYCELNSTVDTVEEQISFITLGLCYRGEK